MASVTSEAVAEWWPLVESTAHRMRGVAQQATGLDQFDDLVQEGAIAAWLELEAGRRPTVAPVKNAMVDYIRTWSHRGLADASQVG